MAPTPRRLLGVSLLALLALALPAVADVLVTKDGARLPTRGGWEVKGGQVLFRQPNGTLSALRLSEVDLDASIAATAREKEPPPPAVAPVRPAVLRLTEKEIPPVSEAEVAAGTEEGEEAAAGEPLAVTAWDQVPLADGGGVEIFGTVTNRGTAIVTAGTVVVSLLDDAGGLLVTETAELGSVALPPGKGTDFRLAFPGLGDFATARFAVSSRGFRVLEEVAPEGAEGEEAAPEAAEGETADEAPPAV